MNKMTTLFSCLFLLFFLPRLAASGEMRLIHVELSYSGAAASYNLYKDGVLVCVSNDTTSPQMDCTVEIDTTPMTFILTAVDASGVESPQSVPYILTPTEVDPSNGNYVPRAEFSADAISGAAPLTVSFDASESSDLDGSIKSYNWNFGDGGVGEGKLFDYTFTNPGTYIVTLTVTDDKDSSAEKTTTITVTNSDPSTNKSPTATITATPLQGGTSRIGFDATASSDADGMIVSYAWDFGDGETATGNYVEHEFLAAGDYTVILTVTDDEGAISKDQIIMSVIDTPTANALPIAMISASSQQKNMHFEWTYLGTDPGLAGFKLYQNSRVVCDIPNPAARQADCLAYIDDGPVQLWVTAYNLAGVESDTSTTLTFDNSGLSPNMSGDAPQMIHFSPGASTDPDGTITSYKWDFGDGSTAEGKEADHIYTVPADYTVTLTVYDNKGGQAQAMKAIAVQKRNVAPISTDKTLTLKEDETVSSNLPATDENNDPITFSLVTPPSHGTVILGNNGAFTYKPTTNFNGSDSFTFKASDGVLESAVASVTLTVAPVNRIPTASSVTPVNHTPTARADAAKVKKGKSVSIPVLANDTDVDKDPLKIISMTKPKYGKAKIAKGAILYTSNAKYVGKVTFKYTISDGKGGVTTGTVNVKAVK